MKQKHTTWHGAELTPVAIKAGFVDYFAAAEAVDAEIVFAELEKKH